MGPNAGTGARVKHFRQRIGGVIEDRHQREKQEVEAAKKRKAWEQYARKRLAELDTEHAAVITADGFPEQGDLALVGSVASSSFLSDDDRMLIRQLAEQPPGSPLRVEAARSLAVRAVTARVEHERQRSREQRQQHEQAKQEAKQAQRDAEQTRREWWLGLTDKELADLVERRAIEVEQPQALRSAFARDPRGSIIEVELRKYAPSSSPPMPSESTAYSGTNGSKQPSGCGHIRSGESVECSSTNVIPEQLEAQSGDEGSAECLSCECMAMGDCIEAGGSAIWG